MHSSQAQQGTGNQDGEQQGKDHGIVSREREDLAQSLGRIQEALSERLQQLERSEGVLFHRDSFEDVRFVAGSEGKAGHLEGPAVVQDSETHDWRAVIFTESGGVVSEIEGQKIAKLEREFQDVDLRTYLVKLENGNPALTVGDHAFTAIGEKQFTKVDRVALLPEPQADFYAKASRQQVIERLVVEFKGPDGDKVFSVGGKELQRIGEGNYRLHGLTSVLGVTETGMPIGVLSLQPDDSNPKGFSNTPFFARSLGDGRVLPVDGGPEESALIQGRLVAAFREYPRLGDDEGSCLLSVDEHELRVIDGERIGEVLIHCPSAEQPHPLVLAVLKDSGRNIPIDVPCVSPIVTIGEVAILPGPGRDARYFFSVIAGQFDLETGSGTMKFSDQASELILPVEAGKVLFTLGGFAVSDFRADLIHQGKLYGVGSGSADYELPPLPPSNSLQARLGSQFSIFSQLGDYEPRMFVRGPNYFLGEINGEYIVDVKMDSWQLRAESGSLLPLFDGVAETTAEAFFPICSCRPFTHLESPGGKSEQIETWYSEITFNAQGQPSGVALLEWPDIAVVIVDGKEHARFEVRASDDLEQELERLHQKFFGPKGNLQIDFPDGRDALFVRRAEEGFTALDAEQERNRLLFGDADGYA